MLRAKAFAEAEPLVRESLAIREKAEPEIWLTFNGQSMLGGALLGQGKHTEAEPLLLAGYRGMKEREASIPPGGWIRLTEALECLVQLYDAVGKKDEAAKWRKELEAWKEAAKRLRRERLAPRSARAAGGNRGMGERPRFHGKTIISGACLSGEVEEGEGDSLWSAGLLGYCRSSRDGQT